MRLLVKSVLREKSYAFALRIINLYKYLCYDKKEYVISKQVLKAGTSIGALVREAEFAQSKADFISKLSIALKEANETDHWLSLLKDSDYISVEMYNSIEPDCVELIKMLTSSIKTTKNNLK